MTNKFRGLENIKEVLEFATYEDGFKKMCDRTDALTSEPAWDCIVEVYNEGWYLKFTGTRSSYSCFQVWGAKFIRKPRNIVRLETYSAQGSGEVVQSIRKVS